MSDEERMADGVSVDERKKTIKINGKVYDQVKFGQKLDTCRARDNNRWLQSGISNKFHDIVETSWQVEKQVPVENQFLKLTRTFSFLQRWSVIILERQATSRKVEIEISESVFKDERIMNNIACACAHAEKASADSYK